MGRSPAKSPSSGAQREPSSLAKALAPEEIARGDYVTLLYELREWPSWFWCEQGVHPREEPVRICHLPFDEPQPLRVRRVCLPFVLVKTPAGDERTLDIRKCRLARLDQKFGGTAWRAYRAATRRRTQNPA